MIPKYFLVIFLVNFIEAGYTDNYRPCPYPSLEHGRVRLKQRARLVRYMCALHYELVGDRYATCRNGHWDSPVPVCVRPGCAPLSVSPNALPLREHQGAWVVTFCLPGYKLEGSAAVYCDGQRWNDTAPRCVETTVKSSLSCDFEDPGICGWTQDERQDFDWKRWNEKTPSNFIMTGPSYDHTYGKNKLGYYMYIESSAKVENATARLLSPVYDSSLTTDGCFQFYYHMYGKDMGGLRVYQKPVNLDLSDMLKLSDEDQKYLLFKEWGNQGDNWYNKVPQLIPMDVDFQIVIEGIRGGSFISDIAIDDVSILRGDSCASAKLHESSPPPESPKEYVVSCSGRCSEAASDFKCGCNVQCLLYRNCCPDFLEMCFNDEPDPMSTSTETLPETQKLVGDIVTTTTTLTSPKTTTTTSKPTTAKATTPKPTRRITSEPPTKPTLKPSTAKPSTAKPTTTKPTIPKITTTKPTIPKTTTPKPTIPKITTPKPTTPKITMPQPTIPKITTPKLTTTKPTTRKITTAQTAALKFTEDDSMVEIEKAETEVNLNKMSAVTTISEKKSSTWKTAVVTILLLALSLSLVYLAVTARSARGRQAIARLRGRTTHDSEVRYLNSADDNDL